MMEKTRHTSLSRDQILALIERWTAAVRNEDRAAIRENHDADMLMFDVPLPFQSRGLDAYMATWETFFSTVEKPVVIRLSRHRDHRRRGGRLRQRGRKLRILHFEGQAGTPAVSIDDGLAQGRRPLARHA